MRLSLHKTTVRALSTTQLEDAGGAWNWPTISCAKPCGSTSVLKCSCDQ
ncbi:MAG TPA: hypothetical protein VL463_01880 [Kofleriaceae bacterium]|nr:hypothetical protein [Kofleriaceae bacterium]